MLKKNKDYDKLQGKKWCEPFFAGLMAWGAHPAMQDRTHEVQQLLSQVKKADKGSKKNHLRPIYEAVFKANTSEN